jgi:hypothetical protein
MMRTPKITGTKGRPFTLEGQTIDLLSRRRKLERVLAKNDAVANSDDLNMRSDTIDMRVTDDQLQRAIAWGASRARATSPSQTMVADSIDVLLPRQRVRELHAVRKASAEGAPDTTKFRTTEKDRLTGDTIIAYFDTIPTKDTTSKPRIRLLVATGTPGSLATSLQHLPPRDTAVCVPAINYVRGRQITVHFDSARVSTVEVTDRDPAGGLYLDPNPDSTNRCHPLAVRDSTKTRDTTGGVLRRPANAPVNSPARPPVTPPATTPPVALVPPAVVRPPRRS